MSPKVYNLAAYRRWEQACRELEHLTVEERFSGRTKFELIRARDKAFEALLSEM